MYILQSRRQLSQGKKKFSNFTFLQLIGKVMFYRQNFTRKSYIFCFLKVIEIYKLLKSGGSTSFSAKEKTKIKCIYYINNMFSKIFIKTKRSIHIHLDFRCTYNRYRFKMIKTCGSIYPLKITKSYLKPLQHSYFNIREFFSKASLACLGLLSGVPRSFSLYI